MSWAPHVVYMEKMKICRLQNCWDGKVQGKRQLRRGT